MAATGLLLSTRLDADKHVDAYVLPLLIHRRSCSAERLCIVALAPHSAAPEICVDWPLAEYQGSQTMGGLVKTLCLPASIGIGTNSVIH